MPVDQQRLERDGVYETRAPIASVMADLGQIEATLDALAALKKKLGRTAGILIVGAIAGFIIGGSLHSTPLILLSVIALAAGIFLWISSARTGRGILKNRSRSVLLRKLLEVLLQDADAKAQPSVRVGLKGAAEVIREGEWIARKKGKEQFYRDSALQMEAELFDGTVFSEEVSELARKRTYVNPRGKSKTKIRNRYLITQKFTYPSGVYGDARRAQESLKEAIRVPESALIRDVRVTEKAIVVKAMVNVEGDIVEASAMAALGVYRILNLARRTASQGGKS